MEIWHPDWLYIVKVNKPPAVGHDERRGKREYTEAGVEFAVVICNGVTAYL
jgi:hypothetical protein